ncbi:MAG: hypothetical protein QOF21_1359, partial [Actinomycetota bacterium]
ADSWLGERPRPASRRNNRARRVELKRSRAAISTGAIPDAVETVSAFDMDILYQTN